MSNALAIAAVTAVLKDLLDNGIINRAVSNVGGNVTVSTGPPDRVPVGANEKNQLNLFLYQVMPNAGWRNVGLPSRNGAGDPLTNPPLALDLHYLLSAYGERDLHAEILLGYAMQILHETSVLSRASIRTALVSPSPVTGGILPQALRALSAADLAEQVEQIKITPQSLSTEDLSKLWSAFQARYRPSAAYQVSVVLIEGDRPTRVSLPVRGREGLVLASRQPVIDNVLARGASGEPPAADRPITIGSTLVLQGRDLRGDMTEVLIQGLETTVQEIGEAEIVVPLPSGLRAGAQAVQVAHGVRFGDSPEPHRGAASNTATFLLRPRIVVVTPPSTQPTTGTDPRSGTLSVQVTPEVGREQRVVLLLNELDPPDERAPRAYSFNLPPRNQPGDPPSAATVTVPVRGIAPGRYLVRLRVDDAENPLEADASGNYASPQVNIP
jgi:hypothetical protein